MLIDPHPLLSAGLVERDFLDNSECAETARRVGRLQDRWTKRSDSGFFTLGAASYLDGAQSHDAYLAAAARTNPVLSKVFDDLYRGLRGFLQYLLDEPVAYDERLAVPGFHIHHFHGHSWADEGLAERAHFDLQFLRAAPTAAPEATLSFTVALEQPSGGAGLAVWPLRYHEAIQRNVSAQSFAAQNPCEQIRYQTGRMVLHDGFVLHAIGGTRGVAPQGRRIMLQGHGVRRGGRWTVYW